MAHSMLFPLPMRAKPNPIHQHQNTTLLCEFSHQPFDECYCRNVSGRTVPNIALFCMERFCECPIYRKHLQQKTSNPDLLKNSQEDRKK